jgi:uncharacterized protein YhaN
LLLERCERELRRLNEVTRDRRQLTDTQRELQLRVEHAESALSTHQTKFAHWQEEWQQALTPLGMPGEASPDEVNVVLDEATELFKKLDEQRELTRRIEGIRRDRKEFESQVQRLVEGYTPELVSLPPDAAAEQLSQRFQNAVRDRSEQKRLERELVELNDERETVLTKQKDAEWTLDELVRSVNVASVAELELCENTVAKAHALDTELRRLEADLLEAAGGAPLESLIEQARGADRASVATRLAEAEEQLERAEEELHDAEREIGSLEKGLELYGDANAADLAQEQAATAAEIRALTRRYAKLRLADVVLSREIERYREQNQGPVLRRASSLFSALTLERYSSLRVGLEDQTIRCVRADGKEIEVPELSEGTSYQLYLALRLASLERHLEHNQALPLVLDDVLIHFDDARKAAAFRVLGELAGRVQILFFTHHAHELELAREAVPKGRLFEHTLQARAYTTSAETRSAVV